MSREAELYKDKIEVSLDGRQIFYLFFGGAVIVGLVFVLGVMVGRRVEARGHTDRARVAATVDPLAALDRLEGGSGLSFQGALRGADGPVSDVEKTIAALPKRDDKKVDKKAEEPKKVEEPKQLEEAKPIEEPKKLDQPKKVDEPKKADEAKKAEEPKKIEEAKKTEEPKKTEDAKKLAEHKVEKPADKKPDEHKTEKAVDKPADKVGEKKDAKLTAEKIEKVADKPTDKKDEPKEEKKTKFTLQLSSFQDKAEAQAYLDSIKTSGYQAYMTEGAVDGKQYFRVRMGSYKTMEAASQAKAELEKSTKKSAIVIKL